MVRNEDFSTSTRAAAPGSLPMPMSPSAACLEACIKFTWMSLSTEKMVLNSNESKAMHNSYLLACCCDALLSQRLIRLFCNIQHE
jgi:hypothetical protein